MRDYKKLLNGVNTLAIVCNQWGDTGKGKFIDYFADWADVIVRGTGGANAGHTISINGTDHIFHLIPSGILHDSFGKFNIIGNGVAFDPKIFSEELAMLRNHGIKYEGLLVSKDAKLVLPQHILIDQLRESNRNSKIGTTGRGIGPAYRDHYDRIGLVVNDLLNKDVLANKLRRNWDHNRIHFSDVVSKPRLDIDSVVEEYYAYGKELLATSMVWDTDHVVRESLSRRILLEGAQGNLLSIDYGTYPYVTASDCSVHGLAKGAGLSLKEVDLTLGIIKGFYMTRVGSGPFPTELGGEASAAYCNSGQVTKESELKQYGNLNINQTAGTLQAIAVRIAGDEYGATTGRPRRIGWLDIPLLRYSLAISGPNTILTKLDVLDQCNEINICFRYIYTGDTYCIGQKILSKNDYIYNAIMDNAVLQHCQPEYTSFQGWKTPIGDMQSYKDLPLQLLTILDRVSQATGMKPRLISVGKDRDQTIICP